MKPFVVIEASEDRDGAIGVMFGPEVGTACLVFTDSDGHDGLVVLDVATVGVLVAALQLAVGVEPIVLTRARYGVGS